MSGIEALFSSKTIVSVLSLLLLNPEQAFYQLEIANRTGLALLLVQKALKRIVQSGFATESRQGRMVYYKANREHPAFEDLKRLLIKTAAIGEMLRQSVLEFGDKVQLAFVFGSYARGEEHYDSDIDLFILGDLSLREASEVLGDLTETTGREVNPVIYSEKEFRQRLKDNNHFVRELHSSPKIWLIGNEDEYRQMAG